MKIKIESATEALQIVQNCIDSFRNEHTGGEQNKVCDGITECGECFLCEEHKPVPAAMKYLTAHLAPHPAHKEPK